MGKKKAEYRKEEEKIKTSLQSLQQDENKVSGMFSRIYHIPSSTKSKVAKLSGQIPRTVNIYGSHYPVVRVLNDGKTILLHTSQYGQEGKTTELTDKIRQFLPEIFPEAKVIHIHHPDYRHSARIMRLRDEDSISKYLEEASINHPDDEYKKHAAESLDYLKSLKKGEYSKPIHAKRMEGEGWDYNKNIKQRLDRLERYLSGIGLTFLPEASVGRRMGYDLPNSISINVEGDPHDQQVIHEAAHALLSPLDKPLKEYQEFIGDPGFHAKRTATAKGVDMTSIHGGAYPEQTAQQLEAGIARRAGVEPFRVPKRNVNPEASDELARKHAKRTLEQFDEGIYSFDPFEGKKEVGSSIDSLINAKQRANQSIEEAEKNRNPKLFGSSASNQESQARLDSIAAEDVAILNKIREKYKQHIAGHKDFEDSMKSETLSILNETLFKQMFDAVIDLEKAIDEDIIKHLPNYESILNWSRKHIPNIAARTWYLNHVAKDPSIHEKYAQEMQHHGAMMGQNRHINSIQFSKKLGLNEGFNQLKSAEEKWIKEAVGKLAIPDENTEKVIDLGNGYAWYNLNKNQCSEESKTMGHCGKGSYPDTNLFSLRKTVVKAGREYHEPFLTFEINPEGIIVQAKGKQNKKPIEKYHAAIMPLLMSKHVSHIIPSGYRPESDFSFSDLSPENQQKLASAKPNFDYFSTPYKDGSLVDKAAERYADEQEYTGLADKVKIHRDFWNKFGGNVDKAMKSVRGRKLLSQHPNTSAEILHKLADDTDEDVASSVAEHPNTSAETLHKLADHPNSSVAGNVAQHPNTSPETLHKLAGHKDWLVTYNVAQHPNISPETLAKLAGHKNEDVAYRVAKHSNTSPETLHKLADHPNKNVAGNVAKNPNTSAETLHKLAGHKDWLVAHAVAENPNTSPETLHKLAGHKNPDVAGNVAEHPNTSPEILHKLADHKDPVVADRVAQHPNTSPETLHKLADHEGEDVASSVAKNPNTSAETLHKLAGHKDWLVASAVAENPNTSPELLAKLAGHKKPDVAHAVAEHPNTSPEILHKLAGHESFGVVCGVAENPNTSPETLHKLAGHWSSSVASNVAKHPNTSPETLAKLAGHKDKNVASSAKAHPNYLNQVKKSIHTDGLFKQMFDAVIDLEKAIDEDIIKHLPNYESILNWSRIHIPNIAAQHWYLNHVAKDPSIHEKYAQEMQHHGAMMGQNRHINSIQFSKKLGLNEGFNQLKSAEEKWRKENAGKLAIPDKNTEKVIDLGNGYAWYNLNKNQCSEESKTMGHCGKGSYPDTNLFSLRKTVVKAGREYHEPFLTFEINPEGIIVQAKGKQNKKPIEKYHAAIMPLLMSKHVSHIIPSGYAPELDFSFSDLSPENQQKLASAKPNFDYFSTPYKKDSLVDQAAERYADEQEYTGLADKVEIHRDFWNHFGGNVDKAMNSAQGRKLLSQHPNTSAEILHKLADHEDKDVASNIAEHPNTSPETLHKLAVQNLDEFLTPDPLSDEYYVKHSPLLNVAQHRNTSPETLRYLADICNNFPVAKQSQKMSHLQHKITQHPNTSPETLDKITDRLLREGEEKNSGDPSAKVILSHLANIAVHKRTSPETINNLMRNRDVAIRVCQKSETSSSMLDKIFNATDFSKEENTDVFKNIANHPNTSPEILHKLADHKDPVVADRVAQHPNTSPETLAKLAGHKDPSVALGVADHPNASPELLAKLADHKDWRVARNVAKHPNTSPEILHKLAGHEDPFVARGVAEHPNISPETLAKLADHESAGVAHGVAKHPNTSPELLAKLAGHKDVDVASSAKAHPNYLNQVKKSIHTDGLFKQMFDAIIDLEKAIDEDTIKHLPNYESILNWSRIHIPNIAARTWYLNHVAKDPSIHEKYAQEMQHHGAMMGQNRHINSIQFSKKLGLNEGLRQLKDAEEKWIKEAVGNLAIPDSKTEKVIDLGNGYAWYNLNKNKCLEESKTMGHCGTGSYPDTNLFSLRKTVIKAGKEYHQPFLTFEINPEGIIVQAKGKQNKKPIEKYHAAIMPLLMSKHVSHIIPSGYAPELDFSFSDLSPENQQKLASAKPNFDYFSTPYKDGSLVDQAAERYGSKYGYEGLRQAISIHRDFWNYFGGNVDKAMKSAQGRKLLSQHPNTSPEILHKLADDTDNDVTYSVAKHPNTSPETLHKLAIGPDSRIREIVAKHFRTSPETLNYLIDNGNARVVRNVAKNPNAPTETLDKLVDSKIDDVLESVAEHRNTSAEALSKLTRSKNIHIVKTAIKNPNAPAGLFDNAVKENFGLAQNLAEDLDTPPEILAKLADHSNDYVAYRVARNPNTSPETLHKLADHKDKDVAYGVAYNKNTSPETLAKLAGHENPDVARSVATNPNTSPETLAKLAGHEDKDVVSGVARHPNTSPEILHKLADHKDWLVASSVAERSGELSEEGLQKLYSRNDILSSRGLAESILRNPLTKLKIVDKLADHKDPYIIRKVAQNSHVQADTLNKIIDRIPADDSRLTEDMINVISNNKITTPEILDKLTDKMKPYMKSAYHNIALHRNATPEALQKVADASVASNNSNLARDLLKRDGLHPEVLAKLADHPDSFAANDVARHPNTSPEILHKLAGHEDPFVARGVAEHPNISPETLDKLADHKDWRVARNVAENPNTSPEILHKLAGHENPDVARSVAKHPNTSPETLHKLAGHENPDVAYRVARNPNTSPELLAKLADHENKEVAYGVAYNKNTSPKTLAKLAGHESSNVVSTVSTNPNTSPETLAKLADHKDEDVVYGVAAHPNTSPETLHKLAGHGDREVAFAVANNKNTSPETLHKLAGHGDWLVAHRVAQHPNTSPETLAKLAGHEDKDVVSGVARHPNTSPEILHKLAGHENPDVARSVAQHPNISPELLAKLADHKDPSVARGVAENPNTSPELLAKLAGHGDRNVAYRVAQHPNTSPETLDKIFHTRDDEGLFLSSVDGLVSNPNVSSELLNKIADQTRSGSVIDQIINHPNTTAETLHKLAGMEFSHASGFQQSDRDTLYSSLINSPKITNEGLIKILDQYQSAPVLDNIGTKPDASPEVLDKVALKWLSRRYTDHEQDSGHIAVAKHPNTSAETLNRLSTSHSDDVVQNVVKHPNTSPETLAKLADHAHPQVISSVIDHPNTSAETLNKLASNLSFPSWSQQAQKRLDSLNQAGVSKSERKALIKELIPGGLAQKKKPSDFDEEQLEAGIKIEMEHTKNRKIAREIAMDHLVEDKDYYKKLKTIEKWEGKALKNVALITALASAAQQIELNAKKDLEKPRQKASEEKQAPLTVREKTFIDTQNEIMKKGYVKDFQKNPSGVVVKETIKKHPDLMNSHSYILDLSPSALQEVVKHNKPLIKEIGSRHYDNLYQLLDGDQEKIDHAWRYGVKSLRRRENRKKNPTRYN